MFNKRKLIVWWCKLQQYPYYYPDSRQRLRDINRMLSQNRKRVKNIITSLNNIKRGPIV